MAADAGGDPSSTPRPLVVLQVRSSPGLHGPERTLLELAPALDALRVRVPLLALYRPGPDDPPEHPLVAAMRSAGLEAVSARDPGPLHPAAWRELARRLAASDLDAVHTHDYKSDLLVALARRRGARLPWVSTVHLHTGTSPRLRFYGRLALAAVRGADRVVVVSEAQAAALAASGFRRSRLALVRTAIDADAVVRAARRDGGAAGARARARVPAGAPLVLIVARLTRQKGVDVALRALSQVRLAVPEATLVVVGDGPEAAQLAALAEALGVADAVRWVGHLANPLPLLAAADVVIMPSRAEGLPRVALEAGALARPLVASSVGGLPEAVLHGTTGLVVPPDDPNALASALVGLLQDAPAARRMGSGAAEHVRARFALAGAALALAGVYRGAIGLAREVTGDD